MEQAEIANPIPDGKDVHSQAIRVGNTFYQSGRIGVAPGSMKLASSRIKEEATQTLENKGELT